MTSRLALKWDSCKIVCERFFFARISMDGKKKEEVKVDCPCGGFISFYHCIFKCKAMSNHFRPVVEQLKSLSLPLTMESLVDVGEKDAAFLAGVAKSVMACQMGRCL